MTEQDIVLIVGNGLSMDLRQQFGDSLAAWNTSRPLSWDLVHPECGRHLRDLFPRAFQILSEGDPSANDFERMTRLVDRVGGLDDWSVVELRHFLVMAFSMYQRAVDTVALEEWRWSDFMHKYAHRLGGVVSFNYDLVLERIARRAGVKLVTKGLPPVDLPLDSLRDYAAVIWKPHGSIDYRPPKNFINIDHTYPLQNLIGVNDFELEWSPKSEWTIPRLEAGLVIPTETSRYRGSQWVEPGERWVKEQHDRWSYCVVVGMSYAPCDREEVDLVLDRLPPHAVVFVVDPNPSESLLNRLDDLSLETICIEEPPVLGPARRRALLETGT